MKKLLILSLMCSSTFALVPITTSTDPNALAAAAQAVSQAGTYLQQVKQASNIVTQAQGLNGLKQLQSSGGSGLCNLCNQSDQQQLQNYVNSINEDLCSQFSNAMSNLGSAQQGFNSISGIMNALNSTNPQAASLSLATSSASTLTSVNNTLAQMQMMQAQAMQKQLAQEKIERQQAADFATNFGTGN